MRCVGLEPVFADAGLRRFEKRTTLLDYGPSAFGTDVFYIETGVCAVVVSSRKQTAPHTQIVGIVGRGHIVGELGPLLERRPSAAVEALTDCTTRALRADVFSQRVKKGKVGEDNSICEALLYGALREVARMTEGVHIRAFIDAELTLLYYLCQTAELVDPEGAASQAPRPIELHLTKDDVFRMTGHAPRGGKGDALQRTWRDLVQAGVVSTRPLRLNNVPAVRDRLNALAASKGITTPLLIS